MNSQLNKINCLNFVAIGLQCLIIGMVIYGTFSFYHTIVTFNTNVTMLQDAVNNNGAHISLIEQKISNCYPNE